MKKLNNWLPNLQVLVEESRNKSFVYGQHDCCLFGADVVLAQTGIDLAADYRGKYKTLAGGIKLLKKAGYADQIDFLEKHLEEIPTAFASVGDIGVVSFEGMDSVCVVIGAFAAAITETGLINVDTTNLTRVFKV